MMYIGRFVIVGRTVQGASYLAYRISSRSFPSRRIELAVDRAVVLPTASAQASDNPYISYNCLRQHGDTVVVANGSHVDPIIEKVAAGYPLRDALALALLALDYEHDAYNTPRIAAGWESDTAYLAIIGPEKLLVRGLSPAPGTAMLIATYELAEPTLLSLAAATPADLAREVYRLPYEQPVASLAMVIGANPACATIGPDAA